MRRVRTISRKDPDESVRESSETTRQALSAGEQSNANAELDEYAEKR
jgi:hypothetical protein